MLVESVSVAWGALVGGAAVGAAGSLVGDILNAILSGGRAKKAFNRQKTIMKNQVQWRVKDMIKAGINPMLAAYTGSAQPASVAMAPAPDIGGGLERAGSEIARIPQRLAELKQTAAQTEYTTSQTELSQAAARKASQDTATSRAEEALKGQQLVESAARTRNENERIPTWDVQRQLLEAQTMLNSAQALKSEVERLRREQGFLGKWFSIPATKGAKEWAREQESTGAILNRLFENVQSGASRGVFHRDPFERRNR